MSISSQNDRVSNYCYRPVFVRTTTLVVVVFTLLVFTVHHYQTRNSNELWNIVHNSCTLNMQINHNPAPCVNIDLGGGEAKGFAILKDKVGNTQFLVIPTEKITGIESRTVWDNGVTNYFATAWMSIDLVDQREHRALPRTDFALAVNSISGRTQNQLHIHVDCIQPEVKSALEKVIGDIGTNWHTLPIKLFGHRYDAMWLPGPTLGTHNPFQLLARSLPNPTQQMGGHTLVLVGAKRDGQDGFILLDGKAPAWAVAISSLVRLGLGSGEELEDHSCHVANGE